MANKKIDFIDLDSTLQYDYIKKLLLNYWKNLAVKIFKWQRKNGEPISSIADGLTSEIIETTLYEKGKVAWHNGIEGNIALPCSPVGSFNIYKKPLKWALHGFSFEKTYNADELVIIKNNTLMEATEQYVDYYCSKMANIELTKELNLNAHKTPLMIECTADTELTARNMFKKIRANEPVIFKNKSRGETDTPVSAVNSGVEFILDKLEDEYHNYEARLLMLLGLDNYVEDKKERVQSIEVQSQDEFIVSSFKAMYDCRKEACEEINKKFGLDLEVVYVKGDQIEEDEPVDENENQDMEVENG